MDEDPSKASTTGFLYALVIGLVVGSVLILVFSFLRRIVPDVFQHRQLLNTWKSYDDYNGSRVGVTEPRPSDSLFGWIRPVFQTSDDEVVRKIGLDAAMFFRYIRSAFYITSILTIFGLIILMPVYGTAPEFEVDETGNQTVTPPEGLNIVSSSNVPPKSRELWAIVVGEFVSAFVVIYFMATDYRYYAKLRRDYCSSENPTNYSVVVYDIPEDQRTESAVRDRFDLMVPGQVSNVIIIRNPSVANKLQKKLDAAVGKREAAEYKRSAKGEEPQMRPGTCGFMMCWKAKVDEHNYWTREQDQLADSIHDQGSIADPTPSAIVVLSSKLTTSLVIQANSSTSASKWHIERAPVPAAVHWPAFVVPGYQAEIRSILVAVFVFFFTLFWSIPATAIAALFTLEKLSEVPAFEWASGIENDFVTGLLTGLLPPIIMSVLISLIPTLFRIVVGQERIASKAEIEVKTRDYFYMFTIYGSFFVVLIGSAFFQDLDNLRKDFTKIVDILATALPGAGLYFATFILVQSLIPFPLMLSGIVRVILRFIFLKLAKTERQKRKARTSGAVFQYFKLYGSCMQALFLALAFSSLAPIVTLSGVIFFAVANLTLRYVVLYMSYNEWDGGGSLHPGSYWGTMLGLVLKQFVVVAVLGLKKSVAPTIVSLGAPIITIMLCYIIHRRYSRIAENGSIVDLYDEAKGSDEVPTRYKMVYDQPAGRVTNYENLNGVVEPRDVYSDVEFDDPDNMDAVHSETLDDSVGYVPDPAADREDV